MTDLDGKLDNGGSKIYASISLYQYFTSLPALRGYKRILLRVISLLPNPIRTGNKMPGEQTHGDRGAIKPELGKR